MRVSEVPGHQTCDGADHPFPGPVRRRPVPQGQLHLGRAVDMTAPGAVEPTTQTAQPLEHPTTDPWEDVADRVRRRWPALSLPGCWGAVLLVCASLTPSLLPREGVAQGVVSGISAAMGYGLGVLAAAVWRALADRGPRPPRRWAWRAFLAAAVVLAAVFVLTSDAVRDRVHEAFAGERAELLFTNLSNEQEQTLREAFAD